MMTSKRIKLKEIDRESWTFLLYEDENKNWYMDIMYKPRTGFEASMMLKLSNEEKQKIQPSHKLRVDFANEVSYHFRDYLSRSISLNLFIIP